MDVIHALCLEITGLIELHYLSDEMFEAAPSLIPLYRALALGPLPDEVRAIMSKIEKSITTVPQHYICSGCGAMFADCDDLGLVTQQHIYPLPAGAQRPIGTCPICDAGVYQEASDQ
jgi:hypothetical protein